jgi:DNA-directed RNA polymerase subunit RPC12/RpoP
MLMQAIDRGIKTLWSSTSRTANYTNVIFILRIFSSVEKAMKCVPVIYKCSKCGSIITVYIEGEGTWYGIPSPSDVVKYIGSKCPVCGKPLTTSIDPDKVVVEVRRQVREFGVRKRRGIEIEIKL